MAHMGLVVKGLEDATSWYVYWDMCTGQAFRKLRRGLFTFCVHSIG